MPTGLALQNPFETRVLVQIRSEDLLSPALKLTSRSDDLDGFCLRAFLAFGGNVGNALVFFQRFEPRAKDVSVVSEKIFAARLRTDETKALFVIEPFDNTSFCLHFLQSLNKN